MSYACILPHCHAFLPVSDFEIHETSGNDVNFGKIARVCLLGDPSDLINFNPWSTAWVPKCRNLLARSLLEMQLEFDEKTCDLDLPSSSCSNSARENLVKVRLCCIWDLSPALFLISQLIHFDIREGSQGDQVENESRWSNNAHGVCECNRKRSILSDLLSKKRMLTAARFASHILHWICASTRTIAPLSEWQKKSETSSAKSDVNFWI